MSGSPKVNETIAQKFGNVQLQTSTFGIPLPVVYGTQRVAGNLLWYGNFVATPFTKETQTGGKGMGGKVVSRETTYSYTAAVIMGLAEGPIAGVGAVWKGKDKASLAELGLSVFLGDRDQLTWSFLTGHNTAGNWGLDSVFGYTDFYTGTTASFTDQAINYSSTAYLAASAYDLGDNASVPNHGFEVRGFKIFGSGYEDANPAEVIKDIMTSTQYGSSFPLSMVDDLVQYSRYCIANGFFVSPAYVDQQPASDRIKDLYEITNSELVWSGGRVKIIPYGDETITGNGVTFTPDLTPLFDLTDDNFIYSEEPVRVIRSSPADAYNKMPVEFKNRRNQYNTEVVVIEDQNAIEQFGLKQSSTLSVPMITDGDVAKALGSLYIQRRIFKRNQYRFRLNARFDMLEPMDIVTLTDDGLDLFRHPVRLLKIVETDKGFDCTAEDLNVGVAGPSRYSHENGLRWQANVQSVPQPVAVPHIFELPPNESSTTGLALGIAAGGQASDLIYGGCRVWVSLDDVTYKSMGVIYGSSRYGTLTATYPNALGLDTTNTLRVALRSGGQLLSGSALDAQQSSTLIVVGQEFISYTTATLTGASAYDLTSNRRGQYGSTPAAHNVGALITRVDDGILRLNNLSPNLIGVRLYFKFTSFNPYQAGEQDISTATSYSYLITGWAQALGRFARTADGATSNPIFSGSTPPTSPVIGTFWKDTSGANPVLRVWTGSSWDRLANDTAVTSISAIAAPSLLNTNGVTGTDPGNLTSASVTVTASGGTSYTYAWSQVSGNSFTINSPSSATTTFTASINRSSSKSGVYRCTITSASGASSGATVTVDVTVNFTETTPAVTPISASASPSTLYRSSISPTGANLTSPSTTVTATGGSGHTYSWVYLDGTVLTVNSPTSATTTFTGFVDTGEAIGATYRCDVTSSEGATASAIVTINLVRAGGSGPLP